MTHGSWIRTVEIHFRPPGSGKIQSQNSLTFYAFTRSYRSTNAHPLQSTTLLLLRDFDPFNQINDPSALSSINDQDLLRVFGTSGTLQCLTPTILWSVEL
jgi:hypothetical protein